MMRRLFLLIVALGLTGPALAESGWAERLSAGEIPVEAHADPQGRGRVRAAIDIPAPAAVVWRTILDCDRAARMTPGVKRCRVISRAPDGRSELREHLVKWSFFLPSLHSTSRVEYEPDRSIRFTCVGGDIQACEGTWTLEPLKGGAATRVTYEMWAAAPFAVPSAMLSGLMRRDVPEALRALRRECMTPP
ncbi:MULTISPECIES: SRPBCC family protein [unclassified Caulobacter]|uniref:SRPBCC family protein n=1 Tax=unclassified Caulobacter TaxID=2648921 RepID=UPI003001D833